VVGIVVVRRNSFRDCSFTMMVSKRTSRKRESGGTAAIKSNSIPLLAQMRFGTAAEIITFGLALASDSVVFSSRRWNRGMGVNASIPASPLSTRLNNRRHAIARARARPHGAEVVLPILRANWFIAGSVALQPRATILSKRSRQSTAHRPPRAGFMAGQFFLHLAG